MKKIKEDFNNLKVGHLKTVWKNDYENYLLEFDSTLSKEYAKMQAHKSAEIQYVSYGDDVDDWEDPALLAQELIRDLKLSQFYAQEGYEEE